MSWPGCRNTGQRNSKTLSKLTAVRSRQEADVLPVARLIRMMIQAGIGCAEQRHRVMLGVAPQKACTQHPLVVQHAIRNDEAQYALIERRQRTDESGGGVTLDEHGLWTNVGDDARHAVQGADRDARQRLPVTLDVQVVVDGDVEELENLVEHLAVLRGDGHHGLEH